MIFPLTLTAFMLGFTVREQNRHYLTKKAFLATSIIALIFDFFLSNYIPNYLITYEFYAASVILFKYKRNKADLARMALLLLGGLFALFPEYALYGVPLMFAGAFINDEYIRDIYHDPRDFWRITKTKWKGFWQT